MGNGLEIGDAIGELNAMSAFSPIPMTTQAALSELAVVTTVIFIPWICIIES
jgi:hypothetical protein